MKKASVLFFLFLSILSCQLQADYLAIRRISEDGLGITLTDGSEWNVQPVSGVWKALTWGWDEQSNVLHWAACDKVEIRLPWTGNLLDFVLVIFNQSKNEQIWATLKQAPILGDEDCLHVVDSDQKTALITTNDERIWINTHVDMYGAFFGQLKESKELWLPQDPLTLVKVEGWSIATWYLLWNHRLSEMPIVERVSPE